MSTVQVRLIRSFAGRPRDQKQTLRAMGLYKLGQTRSYQDNPAVRGMIRKVAHLVVLVNG